MNDVAYKRWLCEACGYIYDEAEGDPDSGLPPGTRYDDIPDGWECPLCGLRKSDMVPMPERKVAPQPAATQKMGFGKRAATQRGDDNTVVIIGAGVAGWSVAEAIRRLDAECPVLLVSACEGLSYPKPALSTACASGKSADDLVDMDAATKAAELAIHVRTETRVIKIDSAKKRITTSKGGIQYGKLVMALGAQQRHLPVSGDASDSILRVNDLKSYRQMRDQLPERGGHITILGAGLIGCEFAEDLSSAGYQVSVIDPSHTPLSSLLDETDAKGLTQQLASKGVTWCFGSTLDSLEYSQIGMRASLSNGDAFDTQLVISAAGLQANTELAQKTGLNVARGIVTDRLMQTSIADIYALGDCAEVEGQIFAYIEPIRRQAETIARNLIGEPLAFTPKSPLIRVKTPSFPLSICLPDSARQAHAKRVRVDDSRTDFMLDDQLVGFILSGSETRGAMEIYQQIQSLESAA